MIDNTAECGQLIRELRPIVLRLMLVSHAPSQAFNPAPPPEDLKTPPRWRIKSTVEPTPHMGSHRNFGGGTRIPRGEIDRKGDLTPEYRQKSDAYFSMTLAKWEGSHRRYGAEDLRDLIKQAEEALDAWLKTPHVAGVDPDVETFWWRCKVADDRIGTIKQVADRHGVSAATVKRYRSKYAGLRRAA